MIALVKGPGYHTAKVPRNVCSNDTGDDGRDRPYGHESLQKSWISRHHRPSDSFKERPARMRLQMQNSPSQNTSANTLASRGARRRSSFCPPRKRRPTVAFERYLKRLNSINKFPLSNKISPLLRSSTVTIVISVRVLLLVRIGCK